MSTPSTSSVSTATAPVAMEQLSKEDRKFLEARGVLRPGGAPAAADREQVAQKLVAEGFLDSAGSANDDSFFGAVAQYQEAHGLKVDGVVGQQTYASLFLDNDGLPPGVSLLGDGATDGVDSGATIDAAAATAPTPYDQSIYEAGGDSYGEGASTGSTSTDTEAEALKKASQEGNAVVATIMAGAGAALTAKHLYSQLRAGDRVRLPNGEVRLLETVGKDGKLTFKARPSELRANIKPPTLAKNDVTVVRYQPRPMGMTPKNPPKVSFDLPPRGTSVYRNGRKLTFTGYNPSTGMAKVADASGQTRNVPLSGLQRSATAGLKVGSKVVDSKRGLPSIVEKIDAKTGQVTFKGGKTPLKASMQELQTLVEQKGYKLTNLETGPFTGAAKPVTPVRSGLLGRAAQALDKAKQGAGAKVGTLPGSKGALNAGKALVSKAGWLSKYGGKALGVIGAAVSLVQLGKELQNKDKSTLNKAVNVLGTVAGVALCFTPIGLPAMIMLGAASGFVASVDFSSGKT